MSGQSVRITDRDRRKKAICDSCGKLEPHRGRGYCVTCYSLWAYWGRPEGGPPKPGETVERPAARVVVDLPEKCRHGHLWSENLRFNTAGIRFCRTCRYARNAADRKRRSEVRHAGHDMFTTSDGRPYCRTCRRGDDDIDEIAIVRAIQGDPPAGLLLAEREAAIVRLRGYGLFYRVIAERVGCSLQTAHAVCARLGVTDPADARACWAAMSADMAVAA